MNNYKEQLELLIEYAEREQYIPLSKIIEVLKDPDEDVLDEVIKYLENENIEVTKDSVELSVDESLLIEKVDDDFEAFVDSDEAEIDEELEELAAAVESEIKVADFEELMLPNTGADDPVKMYLREIGQIELLTIPQELEFSRSVQEGELCKEKIETFNKLGKEIDPEEMEMLREKIEMGNEARNILIESNLRLVVSIAKRYLGRGLPFLDLIQEGNMGLMKAVLKYDPTKGFRFSTYATWWIRQSITRAIADQGRTIRIPVHMVETINKLMRITRKLTIEKHHEPTPEEIAIEMKISVDKVQQIQKIAQEPISFDSTVGEEDDSSLGDFIADTENLNPFEYTEKNSYREAIEEVLQTLTPREEKVIRLRYGLDDNHPRTLEEVGREFGVTRERIRQIETKAIKRLRQPARLNRLRQYRES